MKCGSLVILSRWRPGGHREDSGRTQEDRTGHRVQEDTGRTQGGHKEDRTGHRIHEDTGRTQGGPREDTGEP